MKTMLTRMGIAGMLIFTFTLAKAQDRQMPSAGERASKMTDWMKTNLNLTADELTKVDSINMKYAVKMDSLRNSGQARQDKFAAMKLNDAARDSELKNIFTDEQYRIYQDKKKEMRGRFKDKAKDKSQGSES